jgi:hypothetical protein
VSDKPTLREYQVKDLAFHIANAKSLNLSDPSTGKTPTVCVLFYYWWSKKGWRTVWAMPKSLMEKNREELLRFTDFGEDDVVILETDHAKLTKDWTGPTFTRFRKIKSLTDRVGPNGKLISEWVQVPEEAKDLIAANKDAKVFICTFAFLRNHHERLLRTIPSIQGYGIDELHMGYSTPGSGQTTSFYHVAGHCQGLVGMTGTLIDGRLDSAFPAIHAIEPRYYGSYAGFVDEHAAWINDYGKVERWKNEEKLRAILARHAVRHSFEEVYGNEPVHFMPLAETTLDMLPEQQKAYNEFHEQAMLELSDGRVLDGSMPGVATIRACQIMAHPETFGICRGEVTPKDKRLMEYACEGQPMLVFSAAVAEQERCVKRLEEVGLKVGLINNSVSSKIRNAIDLDFRNGKLDAIVGSGPTVAVGYNWERADHVVGVSWDYRDTNFTQAYRRASRGTRTSVLRVSSLAYRGSVDFRKFDILTDKSITANKVDPTRKVLRFA